MSLIETEAYKNRKTHAHVVPFAIFMVFLVLTQLAEAMFGWDHPAAPWWKQDVAQWIYPIQTIVCLGALIFYRKYYEFRWSLRWSLVGIIFGAVGIGFWILPTALYEFLGLEGETSGWQKWMGIAEREDGFNPGIFENQAAYWTSLIFRFLRAAVIVALIEEIFWRGFIMRFCMRWDGDYWKEPFGRAHWRSFVITTGFFVVAHSQVDYFGAIIYGSLTYLLCVWSKNLGACVVMHAVANFLMGLYAMSYGKYGLW